jgi:hypothetical protein
MTSRILTTAFLTCVLLSASTASAAGIFTLRGMLKSFNDTSYEIQTKSMVYEIRKTGLSEAQITELKTKKTGQEVELVVTTEAVAKVRDVTK